MFSPEVVIETEASYISYKILTGDEYKNFGWDGYDSHLLLKKIRLLESEALMAWECTRKCVVTPGCVSFAIHHEERYCYLTAHNHCDAPTHPYRFVDGLTTYDARPGNSAEPMTTCLNKAPEPFEECGREHCSGENCDICAATCWDPAVIHLSDSEVMLWPEPDLENGIVVRCQVGWQRIWFSTFANEGLVLYDALLEDPLMVKIVVSYGDEPRRSVFEDFTATRDEAISVGNFIHGNAGNYWDAPFSNRHRFSPEGSNCLPFYYSPDKFCNATGVPYHNAKGELITVGYGWEIDDVVTDEMSKFLMSIYVT
ncbi:hypothetical protein SK128_000333 [Halocaridina rubra]|uniref:Uncharacterized protein n=1 Tax=Halocaridina rubra TaxID=373956 RepID=A0AAN9ACL6_HALRR